MLLLVYLPPPTHYILLCVWIYQAHRTVVQQPVHVDIESERFAVVLLELIKFDIFTGQTKTLSYLSDIY